MISKKITISNIEFSTKQRKILHNINLEVISGEVLGFLGPNGSGKTTLFHIITGIIFPQKGFIFLEDINITNYPMYKRARVGLGYLPQESSIFRGMNVEQNINCVLSLFYKDSSVRKEKLNKILHDFSLENIRKYPSTVLSGGERRRVEIARTVATQPKFILFDEPFAAIDPKSVLEIKRLILLLKEQGIGVIITDHNVSETLDIVSRACILFDGSLIFEGSKEEIYQSEEVRKLYLGL